MISRAAQSQHHPFLGPSLAHLGPMLGHLGTKLALQRVSLGTSWAISGPFGALLEGLGRHLGVEIGLGSADLELTCGKKATRQKL